MLSYQRKITLYLLKNQAAVYEGDIININQIKRHPMSVSKLKQLQYEAETWKRMLGFITDENIHLKNRLSEILKENFDNNLLEEVEIFHSHFLKEDERIGLLKNEVIELDKLLVREIFEDGTIIRQVDNKIKRLRRIIKNAEAQFTRLKTNFNNYLSENIIQIR